MPKSEVTKKPRFVRGEQVSRFVADLNMEERSRFRELARRHGVDMRAMLNKMIDVFYMPDKSRGERLCICGGERDARPQLIAGT